MRDRVIVGEAVDVIPASDLTFLLPSRNSGTAFGLGERAARGESEDFSGMKDFPVVSA